MMKPSRTRDERKNPIIYTPEDELRHQLEQQASQKRKQKLYDAIQEKQEILNHYANSKLPTGEGDSELNHFLVQKQQELDALSKQLESQDPDFVMQQARPQDQREIKRKEVFNPVFYDNFFQKDDSASNQARIVSKGELDREKRLKLRDEERMRRLAGVKESAYDNEKAYLPQQPLPDIKQSFQPVKDDFQIPPYLKQQGVRASDQYGEKKFEPQGGFERRQYDRFESLPPIIGKSETERAAIKETLFGGPGAGNNIQQMEFNDANEEKENTPMNRAQQLRSEVQEYRMKEGIDMPNREAERIESRGGARGATPKNDMRLEKNEVQGGIFSRLGGGNQGELTDAEKKRKYREELDAMVQQKKGAAGQGVKGNIREFERIPSREEGERPMNIVRQSTGGNVGGNLPPVMGAKKEERGLYGLGVDKTALEREEKNRKYAEELRQEIAAKEKERERQKQERRVGSAMAANRRNVAEYGGQYQSEARTINEIDVRRDDNRRQSSMAAGPGGGGSMTPQNDSEMDKKKRYREFLDAQVEEKKRIQSAQQGRRENAPLPSLPNAGAGVGGRNNYHEEERYDGGMGRMENYENHDRGYERKAEIPTPKSDIRGHEGGGFFLHNGEDEEKKRAEVRNLQKQKMAEDLKKQMEENEEKKRREKQKKTEEDIRERERIEREADEEKRRHEEEAQKKLEQERKNREPASGPSQNNHVEPEPTRHHHHHQQAHRQEEEEEERVQHNRLQNIPEQEHHEAPLRDASDLSRRRKEDLGEHHPYLSKQDFYRSGNEQPGHRVAFDPNLFPQQGGHYNPHVPAGPNYGSYGSGAGGMQPPMHMGYPPMQPMHMGYMAPPPEYGAFGPGPNMYQEMTNYQNLMQQVMDERLKIERIAMEEQMLLDQYHQKVKEMKLEKMQYEKECERIRLMLQGQIPVTNSVFMDNNKLGEKAKQMEKQLNALSNSYLPTLMNLKNIKASYVSNYNKLLAQSQQGFMSGGGFNPQNQLKQQSQNQSVIQELQDNMAFGETFKTQSAMEESGMFRQSLPAASNFNNLVSKGEMDQSYYKDLEAYNLMKQREENLLDLQQQLQNNPSNFSATLPQATEFRPIEGGSGLNNIDIRDEGSQVMVRKTPDLDENKIKQRQMETTPQVIYDKSPFQTVQKEGIRETSDFDSQLKQGLPVDSHLSAFKMSPKIGGRHDNDESSINKGRDQYLSFNHNAISMAAPETERKQAKSEQEFLDAFEKEDKKFDEIKVAEVKIGGEGRSQKSLVLAEDTMDYKQQEEYDDFLQSNDNAIEELRLGLFKSGDKFKGAFGSEEKMIREDDEDKRGTGFRNQYEKEMVSPRQIGSAMSTGSNNQVDKKYRGPKTIDPFAKVMKSEIRTSRDKEKEDSLFNYKEEEDRVKEKSYNEVSKISGFIMESAAKREPGKSLMSERFEPVMMKEEPRGYPVAEEEEENEAYDEEDYEKISEKIDEKKSEDEEIEEEYALEFEDYDDMGNTMKSKKGGLKGALKGTGTAEKVKGYEISPEKGKKGVSFEKDSDEKAPRVQTADLEALVMGQGGRFVKKEEEEEGKDKRSKTILNRLQRLLDDWEEDREDEQIKIREVNEKIDQVEKNKKEKDLFKPFGAGSGNTNRHSNRYSREGGL